MKRFLFALVIFNLLSFRVFAYTSAPVPDEGMWLPLLIERLNYTDMQKMGLHLTPEEIYSINHSCLKDAVVSLGFFCTAEVVSNEGLLLTNHHCGYESIQKQSTVENNFLKNGYWALSKDKELKCEGLTASFLIRIEDVTKRITSNLKEDMTESERDDKIKSISEEIENEAVKDTKYDAKVKSFYEGNEFYLFVYETFKDVRFVAAPPESIGKFGGDTDNWMWPRHTGDFSMLRVYTAPDGSPAEYSTENIPYKPKYFLPISLKGIKKDDFTMIMGYPGNTDRFLTSYGVKLAIEQTNPAVVKIRDMKLSIMKDDMNSNEAIKLKYSSKYAQSANYWKYFIGQTKGLKKLDVIDKKRKIENDFQKWVDMDPGRKEKYGDVLKNISEGYEELKKYNLSLKYMEEAALQGPELVYFSLGALHLHNALRMFPDKKELIKQFSSDLQEKAKDFYKDYNLSTDKKLFTALFKMYYDNVPKEQYPEIFQIAERKYKGDFKRFADDLYKNSIFISEAKLNEFLAKPKAKVLEKDLCYKTMLSIVQKYLEFQGTLKDIQDKINRGDRLFVEGLREMNPNKIYSSNANSTMRLTYGKVGDYYPADAVHYDYKTTLRGVMEKEDSTNEEFIVPKKLKELYNKKDFGRYSKDGNLYTCFISNNDITGGNSGSPVMNADGQLIGIAFDGNWEAMSGDIAYEPEIQRTINVDIRYVLFIIDKLGGAQNLINEMKIIE